MLSDDKKANKGGVRDELWSTTRRCGSAAGSGDFGCFRCCWVREYPKTIADEAAD